MIVQILSPIYSLVQSLQSMDLFGETVSNEYDCPLYSLSKLIYCIPSKHVCHSVSVVHECTNTCTFVTKLVPKKLEHEDVNISSLIFEHNWSNNMYCHNLY